MNQWSWFLHVADVHKCVILLLVHLTSVWWHTDPPTPPCWLIKLALVYWNYLMILWISLGFCTILVNTSVYTTLLLIHLTSVWWHADPPPPSLLDNQVGIGVLEPSDDLRQTFKVPDLGFCMLLMYTSVWSYSSFIWHLYDGINTDPCPPLASLCQVIKLALVYWNYLMTIWINDQVPTFCFPRLLKNTSVPFLFTPGTWSKGGACRSTGCPGWLVRSFIGFLSSL